MSKEIFERETLIIGADGVKKLNNANVIVFGLGGVGSYVVEALARAGVGRLTLVDGDVVQLSNVNRQLFALLSTVGRYKAEVAKERVLDINPDCAVTAVKEFFTSENADKFNFADYDYVADAIDSVTNKLLIAVKSDEACVPEISAMGCGNKLNGNMFEVADVFKTTVCPLARVMRRELKARGIKKLKAVYSKEEPIVSGVTENGRPVTGSISFVPSAAGLLMAGEIIKDLIV